MAMVLIGPNPQHQKTRVSQLSNVLLNQILIATWQCRDTVTAARLSSLLTVVDQAKHRRSALLKACNNNNTAGSFC